MSKSLIYTANTSVQNLAVDSVVSPGTVVRRFGPNLNLSGNAIQIAGAGYYDISASFIVAPTAAGEVTITAYVDKTPIQGAVTTGTVAAGGDFITLSSDSVFRQPCQCCEGLSNLTFILTGTAANVTNTAIVVDKK